MPSKVWNDATDRQLLLVMIHLAAPKLPNWDQVAELMGDNFTAAGVRQQFQKLRSVSAAHFGALGGSKSNNSSATTTPRKPKTMKDSMTPSGSNKKRKITTMPADDVDEVDDEEIPMHSPSKIQAIKMELKEEPLDEFFI